MAVPSTIFPFRADLSQPIRERYGHATDVMESEDGTEQRVQIRAKHTGGIAFDVFVLDREAQLANALLFGGVTSVYGVPLWQYATPTSATLTASDTQVTIGTGLPAEQPYAATGWVIIWVDAFTYHVATVTGTTSTSIQFTEAYSGATIAAGGAIVMPLVSGWLSQDEVFSWDALGCGTIPVSFDYADAIFPTAATVGSSYNSIRVMDAVVPVRDGPKADEYRRRYRILDNRTGIRSSVANTAAPSNVRSHTWFCGSRAEAKVLRDFVDARKGRAVPTWCPTWQQDLTLFQAASGTNIRVKACDYASRLYGSTNARRHLMLRDATGPSYHKVTSILTPGSGYEDLAISPALPRTFQTTALVSFLIYSRMETDEAEILWYAGNVCDSVLQFRDLPRETP